ncbi:MAG: ATP-dependent DNA helicase [Chloracidobacterium sp.]|nr:ATP-dependent DNA helicase [Chloracidobacterium validum]
MKQHEMPAELSRTEMALEEVFGPSGRFAQTQPSFEFRPGQLEMARAVYDVLRRGGHLCVEAGTGTGKTLAYLVPAILQNELVIISTATKNLQEQILQQDIPRLEQALGRQIRAAMLKGRSNYLCLHRLEHFEDSGRLPGLGDIHHFDAIRQWSQTTPTGDRAELTALPENLTLWGELDARTENCLGQKCPKYDDCFVTRARQRAREADLVIVNHHLFFADLAARHGSYGAFLPDHTRVIFDEAHEIEDTAASYFSLQISNYRFADLLRDVEQAFIPDDGLAEAIRRTCRAVRQSADHFWQFAQRICRTRHGVFDGRGRLSPTAFTDPVDEFDCSPVVGRSLEGDSDGTAHQEASGLTALADALEALADVLQATHGGAVLAADNLPALRRLEERARGLRSELLHIVCGDNPNYVYWWERRGRGLFLQATPIDVAGVLREQLFGQLESVILTSATLASQGSFDFIRSRLGLDRSDELLIDSPFDYSRQARLYLPPDLPDPTAPDFTDAAVAEIIALLAITQGRAFVLCTSLSHMRRLYDGTRAQVNFPCLLQGDAPKSTLIEHFRRTPGAVLFGAASFWQGVDVVGEALSCVIVDRLPFPVPSDPVIEARCCHIEAEGGNAFQTYSLPQAILALKQGLGRLIRSSTDRGILCLLDGRIRKWYGQVILSSLPSQLPIIHDRQTLARWFTEAVSEI